MKIEMLDLDGKVTEVCEATEEVLATEDDDEGAFCDDDTPSCSGHLYRWTMADGMTFQACTFHINHDDFSRFADPVYESGQ